MTAPSIERFSEEASALLQHYSFDLAGYSSNHLIAGWKKVYAPSWIRAAVIEALYQGRYKAVSVEQILAFWLRRGQPLRHFNHEFERIVCNQSGHKRARKNISIQQLSEASTSTSAATHSVEQDRDRLNQQSNPSSPSDTAANPTPELIQPLVDPNADDATREHSSTREYSKELEHQFITHELASLGDLTQSSSMEESSNDGDDFEPPDNPELFRQIRQFSKQPAASFESQPKPTSDNNNTDARVPGGGNSKNNASIHKFKPASDCSDFYLKLRAVAQQAKNGVPNPVD